MKSVEEILSLKNLKLPDRPAVQDVVWYRDVDWVGDPALEITVVLPDDAPEEDRHWDRLKSIDDVIVQALTAEQIPDWPFIHYATASEMSEDQAA